jgi:hypothetical protein
MKKLALIAASAAVLATSPVLAAPAKHHHLARNAHAQMQIPTQMGQNPSQADPYDVYVDGHYAGRDPDPNVREELKSDWYATHGLE